MELPRVRIKVRRMMVAVAVVGLILSLLEWRRRSPYCLREADRWAREEGSHAYLADSHERMAAIYRRYAQENRGSARYNHEQARVFERAAVAEWAAAKRSVSLRDAYRRAARYPWLAVAPDGPVPE
jgi:hypothetical protein